MQTLETPAIAELMLAVNHLEDSLEDARGHLSTLQAATPTGPNPADFDDVATLTQARAAHASAFEQHHLQLQSAGDLIATLAERLAAKRAELAKAQAAENIAPQLDTFRAKARKFKAALAAAQAAFEELEAENQALLDQGFADAYGNEVAKGDRFGSGYGPDALRVYGWRENRRWPAIEIQEKACYVVAGDYARYCKD